MNQSKKLFALSVIAVFDFDGTLSQRDSLLPFLQLAVGRWQFWWGLLLMSPILLGYALKLIPNWQAKEILLNHFLAGWTEERLNQIAQNFVQEEIPKLLRPEALQRLHWHQEQGHQTILVSASLEVYLLPWAKSMNFDQVTGSQLEVQDGYFTGHLLGRNCYGQEKVERLRALLGDFNNYCIYAYGDSRGDFELLNAVNHPYYRTFENITLRKFPFNRRSFGKFNGTA